MKYLKGWLMLAGAVIFLIMLPIIAAADFFGSPWKLVGQVVLSIMLILGLIGTGLFGYICFRAQARKWGAGLLVIAVLCIVAIYLVWTGRLLFL